MKRQGRRGGDCLGGGHTFRYVFLGEAIGVEWTHLPHVFLGSLGCQVEDRWGQRWQGNQWEPTGRPSKAVKWADPGCGLTWKSGEGFPFEMLAKKH